MQVSGKEAISKVLLEGAGGPGLKEALDNLAQAQEKLSVMQKKLAPAQGRERQLQSEISRLKAKRDSGDLGDGEDLGLLSRQLVEKETELSGLTPWLNSILGSKRSTAQGPNGPAFMAVQRQIKEAKDGVNRALDLVIREGAPQFRAELVALFSAARDLRDAWKGAVEEVLYKYGAQAISNVALSVDLNKFNFDW